MKIKGKQQKINLIGKYVKFRGAGRRTHYGRVSSIEDDIANIKGIEQPRYTRPAYHYNYQEIKIATHDEVFNLGRSILALMKLKGQVK